MQICQKNFEAGGRAQAQYKWWHGTLCIETGLEVRPLLITLPWSYWTSVPPAVSKWGLEVSAAWIWQRDMQSNWCKSILISAHARDNQRGVFLGVLLEHFLTPGDAHPNPLDSDDPSSYFCGPEDSSGGMFHLYLMPPWRFCLLPFTTDLDTGCSCPMYVYLSSGIRYPGLMDWLLP